MSPEFLLILFISSIILLLGSIAMSAYLIYDLISGNYRKLLSPQDEHEQQPHL